MGTMVLIRCGHSRRRRRCRDVIGGAGSVDGPRSPAANCLSLSLCSSRYLVTFHCFSAFALLFCFCRVSRSRVGEYSLRPECGRNWEWWKALARFQGRDRWYFPLRTGDGLALREWGLGHVTLVYAFPIGLGWDEVVYQPSNGLTLQGLIRLDWDLVGLG